MNLLLPRWVRWAVLLSGFAVCGWAAKHWEWLEWQASKYESSQHTIAGAKDAKATSDKVRGLSDVAVDSGLQEHGFIRR